MSPELHVPVAPFWVDNGHHERCDGAKERSACDEPTSGKFVDE